jgi:hypothetical protein
LVGLSWNRGGKADSSGSGKKVASCHWV